MANAHSPTRVLKIFLYICMKSCKKFQNLIESVWNQSGAELGGATAPPKFCLAPPKFSA